MRSKEALFESEHFTKEEMEILLPICEAKNSDSANLDAMVELLFLTGRSTPHVMTMLIPEAWQDNKLMDQQKKAYYKFHASLMEPWDGPAAVCFADGRMVGATLDRNGLRPGRYCLTSDDRLIVSSEAGAVSVDPSKIIKKGRLEPGKMIVADLHEGRFRDDFDLKSELMNQSPYHEWIKKSRSKLRLMPVPENLPKAIPAAQTRKLQQTFGFTTEDLRIILKPMVEQGKEPVGSMGEQMEVPGLLHLVLFGMPDFPGSLGWSGLPKRLQSLKLKKIIKRIPESDENGIYNKRKQQHPLKEVLDRRLIESAKSSLEKGEVSMGRFKISSTDRSVGAMLSNEISKRYRGIGLPDATIRFNFRGSAGQSFGAFAAPGIKFALQGEANDYFGKGLSGGQLIVFPDRDSTFIPHEHSIIGNVALYGATKGEVYVNGIAGERFAVRNSGAMAVVEGVGDHGCEYMTGGRVVILGGTGKNFAAGMSGGIAYIYDAVSHFESLCNMEMVAFEEIDFEDSRLLKQLITNHMKFTGSSRAEKILADWSITQIELLAQPPNERSAENPWPEWPMVLRTSSSHEEGADRKWAILTKEFVGEAGKLTGLKLVDIKWGKKGFTEIKGSERVIPCQLALIAAGFLHPQKEGMIDQLGVELDERGNVKTTDYATSVEGVYAAGDMRRGQSLVVWAISEGREAARAVDKYLQGATYLESKEVSLV
ncbi:Glutamate synthase [NADH] (Glutamine-oxoglutarate aminotransferase) (GOGAT) [Durusdinium trenchii]|uniref:Glutamate synthase [NADH] (Glutamine-oxoglutarate aminotransferase) (GOGAT) n=1 Tax=Durusdinium trenchii TaxID=1381693 RepID=A0ABP0HMA2_9DINO